MFFKRSQQAGASVTVNGEKVAWAPGGAAKIELARILGKVELSGTAGTAVRIDDERGQGRCTSDQKHVPRRRHG